MLRQCHVHGVPDGSLPADGDGGELQLVDRVAGGGDGGEDGVFLPLHVGRDGQVEGEGEQDNDGHYPEDVGEYCDAGLQGVVDAVGGGDLGKFKLENVF